MRSRPSVFLAALMPALLLAQTPPASLPIKVVKPGIFTRIEKFPALTFPGVQITGMVVDQRGFLWCRTNRGIGRFDGYELKFYQDGVTESSVPSSDFQSITVDGDGDVWAGTTAAGLMRIDPETGRSRWYRGRDDDPAAIGAGANRLLTSSDGELWAAGKSGLLKYDRHTDAFVRYGLPPGYDGPPEGTVPYGYPFTSICELGSSIWVGLVRDGLAEFDRDTHTWRSLFRDSSPGAALSGMNVRSVCAGPTGHLWIGSTGGIDRYDPRSSAWKHFALPAPTSGRDVTSPDPKLRQIVRPWSMVHDDFGGLWIASLGSGVIRLDTATGSVQLHRHDENDENSIPSDHVLYLYGGRPGRSSRTNPGPSQPHSSIIWIPPSIYGAPSGLEGTHRAIIRSDPSTSVLFPAGMYRVAPVVCGLAPESPGKTWVCLYTGEVTLCDLQTETMTAHKDSLYQLSGMKRLRDGTVLAFTRTHKARTVDPRHRWLVPFCPELNVTSVLEENDESLWLGCRSADGVSFVAVLERRTGRITTFPRQDADSSKHRDELVTTMCRDGNGGLWYGTAGGGVTRFDLLHKTYRRLVRSQGVDGTLPANGVTALVPDFDGRIWVGTIRGLASLHSDRGTFEPMHSRLQEGSDLYIRDMADDGEGHLWIAAHERVVCFTKGTNGFREIPRPASFENATFWSVSYDPETRTVAFGGRGGFFILPLETRPDPPVPPPVVLTSFKVFEKPYPLDGEVWSLRTIPIDHTDNFFSFTYAALDYVHPAHHKYAYRLEGVDPDWVYAGTRRYASYTSLAPGRYLFRVRGSNSEGIWNEAGTEVEIIIPPPWYRTTWAYAAYFLLFGGLVYAGRRYDRKRVALKQGLEMKEFETRKIREIDEMKSRFFANISHEFRTPLTLMLGPIDRFMERFAHDERARDSLSMVRRNALRLLELVNQLLDLSRLDAGRMNVQVRPLDLVACSRTLVLSFQSHAESRRIGLVFDPEQDEIVGYTDRDKFEKILCNLLSNALKFTGEEGEIRVVVRVAGSDGQSGSPAAPSGRRLELVVSDTGIGIDEPHLGKVFDRFYQVEASQRQGSGGTGLGLALTKELVDLLKGEIAVQSVKNKGSVFVVRLPLDRGVWRSEELVTDEHVSVSGGVHAAMERPPEQESPEEESAPREPGRSVVLVVDDHIEVRRYIREILERAYSVEEAGDGNAALHKARDMKIDLVISDVMMPVMDGIQLCRELQADERTSHLPIILLTARATAEGKLEGLETGADDYLVKPFDAQELVARVRNLIASRRKLREKYHRQVTLGPTEVPLTSADERFLKRLTDCIEQHVAESEYDTEALAHDLCMSRMQLNRKLHALTGHSTHDLVRQYRLQRAARMLQNRTGSVSEVAFESGFNSLSHFARAFRQEFGILPSDYRDHPPGETPGPKPEIARPGR